MSRGINVKIATVKVIKSLENALAKLEKDYKDQAKNEKAYQKALENWQANAKRILLENVKLAHESGVQVWRGRATVSYHFDLDNAKIAGLIGAEPERDFEQIGEWQYKEQKEEISNAIRLLKMTDEEVVSTSTYKSIAKYL